MIRVFENGQILFNESLFNESQTGFLDVEELPVPEDNGLIPWFFANLTTQTVDIVYVEPGEGPPPEPIRYTQLQQNTQIIMQNDRIIDALAPPVMAFSASNPRFEMYYTLYYSGDMLDFTLDEAVTHGIVTQPQADKMREDKRNRTFNPVWEE